MNNLVFIIRRITAVALLGISLAVAATAVTRVDNTVTVTDLKSQALHITTTISGVNQPQLEVGIPNWDPGYYTTEDFARNLVRLVFTDQNGKPLYHQKTQDSLWILNTRGVSSVKIEFDYSASELDLNKSLLNPTYGILNGINFFFYVKGHTLDLPESVTYTLPAGWRVATGLVPTNEPATFNAESYDVLVDSPAIVGEFDMVTLMLRGVPHHWVIAPKGLMPQAVLDKLAADSLKVIDAHTSMFGEIPYKQYITFNVFANRSIGGLEHLNSYLGILAQPEAPSEDIQGLIGLTSHEFFHAYNVKRIRPAEMWPYRYYERNYTPLLWVSEGVTDYYTDRGLLRAGLLKPDDYLQAQWQLMMSVQAVEAAKFISVEEASINTWLGGIGGQSQPFGVDYYSRGDVLGLLLDLSIRHDTKSAATLDTAMRSLYENFYKKNRGFTTEDLIATINRITKTDYHTFFEKYVGGTEPLPYDEVLAYAGLHPQENTTTVLRVGIGTQNGGNVVVSVTPGGAAEAAGVEVGDVMLGIGDIHTGNPDWPSEFRKKYANRSGETATLYVLREGKPLYLSLKISYADEKSQTIERMPTMTAEQKAVFDGWVNGK